MKNEKFWLLVIFIIGVILRIIFLDKSCGLSYDELVSFKQAYQPNIISTVFYTLKTDVHMPLYQVLLHLWCQIFNFSDITLRAFSAFCGILSVIVAYFIGKELNNNSVKFLCPSLFAINSFFIYYSQEVRMYSLLILLATLSILYFLRIKNNNSNKWDYFALTGTCFALINTYTIAFIYVFSLIVTLFIYMLQNKRPIKTLILSTIFLIIICLPTLLLIILNPEKWTSEINGYYCDWSSLFIIFQDLYSPVLESLANNPTHYIQQMFFTKFSLFQILFIMFPTLLGILGLCFTIKKDKEIIITLVPATVFFLAEIIAFKFTNFKILPRYVSVAMPTFLVLTAYGFSLIPKKMRLNIVIPATFIAFNLLYMPIGTKSAYKIPRTGFKQIAQTINTSNTQDGDYILVWNRREILDKYLDKRFIILSTLKDFAYKSETMIAHEQEFHGKLISDRKNVLQNYFSEDKIPNNTLILMSYIIRNMKQDQKFIITTTPEFLVFNRNSFKELVANNEKYDAISLNDLLTIKSLIDIREICDYNLKFIEKKDIPPYTILIYSK